MRSLWARRHMVTLVVTSAALCASVPLIWVPLRLPPPRLMLRYGPYQGNARTGRAVMILGIRFIELGPGCYIMGSHDQCDSGSLLGRLAGALGIAGGRAPRHDGVGCPPHWVEVTHAFWLAATEVTNGQFAKYHEGYWGSQASVGSSTAASQIGWYQAMSFCDWLSAKFPGRKFRLPTEVEWEYACRGGSTSEFCFGDDEARLEDYGWCSDLFGGGQSHQVGQKRPNVWGFFDMHGNVYEWCLDSIQGDQASGGETSYRVLRGGMWLGPASKCRSVYRERRAPDREDWGVGFRVAFTVATCDTSTEATR